MTGIDANLMVALGTVLAAHALAAISPGPSFLVVARRAAAGSRGEGLASAMAMGLGAGIWAAAAMFGLQAMLGRFAGLYAAMQVAGALFLLYVAWMMWRHADAPLRAP